LLAHLLLSAVIALLVVIIWRLWRRGSIQTQVAGDQVTPEAVRAAIAEANAALQERVAQFDAELAALNAVGNDTARELEVITQVLKFSLTADARSNEQQGPASVCDTGGHVIRHRVR
jgi:hypothetical protein